MSKLFASGVFTLAATLLVAPPAPAAFDHLKCYKMKDVQTFDDAHADIATISPTFAMQNCRIKKKAKQFCVPASKSVTNIDNGADNPFPADTLAFEQVCYKITCPNVTIAPQVLSDQFGTRTVDHI